MRVELLIPMMAMSLGLFASSIADPLSRTIADSVRSSDADGSEDRRDAIGGRAPLRWSTPAVGQSDPFGEPLAFAAVESEIVGRLLRGKCDRARVEERHVAAVPRLRGSGIGDRRCGCLDGLSAHCGHSRGSFDDCSGSIVAPRSGKAKPLR